MARLAAVLSALLVAFAAAGCAKQVRPDPTAAEWEHAVDVPAIAPARVKAPGPEPKLVSPADGVEIDAKKLAYDQGVIVFTWSESTAGSLYTVEVAADANFTKVVLRKTVRFNTLPFRMTSGGRFFWRVRTDAGVLSNVQSFSVEPGAQD